MVVILRYIIVIFFISFFGGLHFSFADETVNEEAVIIVEEIPVTEEPQNTGESPLPEIITQEEAPLTPEESQTDSGSIAPLPEEINIPENSDSSGSILVDEKEVEIIPSIDLIYTLQSPSYITETEENTYVCDPSETECKVNFDLRQTFGGYIPVKYACIIDFGFQTGEENKCNPNTVIFPKGEYTITFSIFEKDNPQIFGEKTVHILNQDIVRTIPNPVITVQSGLDINSENEFTCKSEACSVNLTAENSFTGEYIESAYECSWNFGSGVYDTIDTDKKCNPGYVQFGSGTHTLALKIQEKGKGENYKEVFFTISNHFGVFQEVDAYSGAILEENLDISSSTGETIEAIEEIQNTGTGEIIPPIIISFQSPSYVIFSSEDNYACDSTKSECKVNFDMSDTFGGYVPSKYACHVDFSFQTGEEEKCNPNSVIFPIGDFSVHFTLYEKENPTVSVEKVLTIKNPPKQVIGGSGGSSSGGSSSATIEEDMRDIIIQSGLEKDASGNYFCEKEECHINLTFQKKSKEECLWDFGNLLFKEKYAYTCNPGVLYVPPGEHKVVLTAGEKTYTLAFINRYLETQRATNIPPQALITLQGTHSKNKKLEGKKLICFDTEECSINVTGKESFDVDSRSLNYEWNLGNGDTFSGVNPKSLSYIPGKYKITLTVSDDFYSSSDYLYVEVLAKGELQSELIDENIVKYLKIHAVNPNPVGVDSDEWIELKNTSLYFLNLKGLIIDDTATKGSKAFSIEYDFILPPFAKKKLYKYDTGLNLGNENDEINIFYNTKLVDSLHWDFLVPENYIITKEKQTITSQKVKVLEVIDGDTLFIELADGKKEKLRLIGVDTPETKHPKKKVEFFGKEASNFTKEKLFGKEVYLEIDKENYRDKYMRLLGYIYTEANGEKISFNKLLIEKGYARAYLVFPFQYSVEYKKAQDRAKKEKLGMWADKEMVKEINLLIKEEKDDLIENEILQEDVTYIDFLSRFFEEQSDVLEKIYYPEKTLQAMYFTFIERWKVSPDGVMLVSNVTNKKQDDLEKSFYQKISLLKSGVKFSGKTQANSEVKIEYGENTFITYSDANGIFSYLQKENITVGKFLVNYYLLKGNEVSPIVLLKDKDLVVTSEYISEYQKSLVDAEIKKLEKLEKKTKTQKVKKKKIKTKKLPKVIPLIVDIKTIQNEIVAKEKHINIYYYFYFFLLILGVSFFYASFNKEEKMKL